MRQVFLLLSLLLASLCAYAQPATCTVSASPQSVRSQGRTELLPQIEVDCTGGPFTTNESFVPKFDVTLTLSAPVTSQVLLGDFTEALLIFNDPDQMFQLPCPDPAEGCDVMGTNDGNGIYDGITRPNIYQAEVTAPNQLTWHGVHLDGYADAHYVFRIRNVRTDVSGLTADTMVTATLGITGPNAPAILPSPTFDVADVQPALQVEVLNVVQGGFVPSRLRGLAH